MSRDRDTEPQRKFEIQFFERILTRWPEFPEVMFRLGNLYTQTGRYQEGADVDRRLTDLRPDDPIVHYNLACSLALLDRLDEAFSSIERAMVLGYLDFHSMDKDPDLAGMRADPRYRELCQRYGPPAA
ncbi:MAG: tetratricopeptide repeat protein [Planctomycetes bacterium]|nr:tetratricopeptide repeat protein [Planctomycetota bacterium]